MITMMMEEMVVEYLTEEERERIRNVRFHLSFGTEEVSIQPKFTDKVQMAGEPFVVTDMNFEREAAV